MAYETRREEIARDFFKYLHDFSNGGWYGGEYRQQGPKSPHLLREEYHHQDRYFGALFRMAQQLLQNAYEDSGAHQYASLFDVLMSPREVKKPASQWSRLFPEVKQIISAHGPDVRQAFQTIFDICKLYQKSVEDTPADYNGRTITREKNNLTQEQSDQLHEALLKVWQAYPETDTRISEGFDYLMSDPAARKAFVFPSPIGGVSAYSIKEHGSEERSDYRLLEMLESYDGEKVTRLDVWKHEEKIEPEALVAIAAQTYENLEKLQEFSIPIAERCLAGFLKIVHNKDGGFNKEKAAKEILSKLASGTTTVEQEAQKIRKGKYGTLAGSYKMWLQPDDERQRVLAVTGGAKDYLQLCMDVHSGKWFGQERDKIVTLCSEENLPGLSIPPASITPPPAPAFT